MSVVETITGLEDNDFYERYYNSSKSRVVNFVSSMFNDYIVNNGYSFKEVDSEAMHGAQVQKKYNSINEFYEKSSVYKQYFNNCSIDIKDGIVKISLTEKKVGNGTGIDRAVVNEGTISIELPFKVLKHNANEVNNSRYTWNIDSFKGDKLYIEFNTKIHSSSQNVYYYIIAIVAVVLIIIITLFIFIKKMKTSNKV